MAESQGTFSRLKRKFKEAFKSLRANTSKSSSDKGKQRTNLPVYIDEPNPTEQIDDVKTKDWAARASGQGQGPTTGPSTVRRVEPEDDVKSGNGMTVAEPVSGHMPGTTQDTVVPGVPSHQADDEIGPLDPAPPVAEQSAPLQYSAAAWLLPEDKNDAETEGERPRKISETPSMSATSGPLTESFEDLEARHRAGSVPHSAGKNE